MMYECDHDPPEFYEATFVRGRKEYRCDECLDSVKKGDLQEFVKGKWDGEFSTFRTCMTCVGMREEMGLGFYCHGRIMDDTHCGDYDHLQSVRDFNDRRRRNYDRIHTHNRPHRRSRIVDIKKQGVK